MKRLLLPLIALLMVFAASAGNLVLIKTNSLKETKQHFLNKDLTIHFYNDNLIIATSAEGHSTGILLDVNAWSDQDRLYYLVYLPAFGKSQDPNTQIPNKSQISNPKIQNHLNSKLSTLSSEPATHSENLAEKYRDDLREISDVLYQEESFAIVKITEARAPILFPAIHGGLIHINRNPAQLRITQNYPGSKLSTLSSGNRNDINSMITEVDSVELESIVQHLQNYGTRKAYTPEAVLAQNWIFDQFESYGLDVELHDFWMPGGEASDNVIATLTGTKYPDEYVVCGGHYDSYTWSGPAPGADDNATGTAGVLEAARILSQYEFDRSIIFAAWGGEEYGLYGSEAWASEAAADGMNILGYFNMDMAGYLHPGNEIRTDIIAPSSAQELVDFYTETCAIYLPDFIVSTGFLSGGDSDHTSFNNNGYMGIFPFEDADNYSPYIHSPGDTIGPSVNSFTMHRVFTQAMLANVVRMADMLPSPSLAGTAGDGIVELEWNALDEVDLYNIYRDMDTMPYATTTDTVFADTAVDNFTQYSYFVTAIFTGSGEEGPASNTVTLSPTPPLALPYFEDYETGAFYWNFEDTWGLHEGIYISPSHSMTESPGGDYDPGMNASATLRALNFSGLTDASLSFFTRYNIENDYDYMYLEVSTGGQIWGELDVFTGQHLAWDEKTYSLNDYIGEENVTIRFRFTSDGYVEESGMHIDDFTIVYNAVGLAEPVELKPFRLEQNRPNPFYEETLIEFYLDEPGRALLELFDPQGRQVRTLVDGDLGEGLHQVSLHPAELEAGYYYYKLTFGNQSETKKLIVLR